jgi:hypothetical protein
MEKLIKKLQILFEDFKKFEDENHNCIESLIDSQYIYKSFKIINNICKQLTDLQFKNSECVNIYSSIDINTEINCFLTNIKEQLILIYVLLEQNKIFYFSNILDVIFSDIEYTKNIYRNIKDSIIVENFLIFNDENVILKVKNTAELMDYMQSIIRHYNTNLTVLLTCKDCGKTQESRYKRYKILDDDLQCEYCKSHNVIKD